MRETEPKVGDYYTHPDGSSVEIITDSLPQWPIPCRDCRYWDHKNANDGWALCRRNAPSKQLGAAVGEWPLTYSSDWCGEATER